MRIEIQLPIPVDAKIPGEHRKALERVLPSYLSDEGSYKARAEAMGFTFSKPTIDYESGAFTSILYFKCVCGTEEVFKHAISVRMATAVCGLPSIYESLYMEGSFSKEHLLADGFSEVVVEGILSKERKFVFLKDNPSATEAELEVHSLPFEDRNELFHTSGVYDTESAYRLLLLRRDLANRSKGYLPTMHTQLTNERAR